MTVSSATPMGLAALEARLRQDLEWLELPAKSWVPPHRTRQQRSFERTPTRHA
ncbi:hypothetical protein LJR009_000523 [Bosea sp. LjRoot9]|uniref:hypothetical protein n=1 Tax=Bosea sp. LjRoot9 TaxID=3342341 RepID=UPI003ECFDB6A